jgi:hypothetical protein
MMIFHNSSFLPLLFATVAVVVTVINPVAYGQDESEVQYLGFKCRPAVDEYATCESTGNIWNIKAYCMDSKTSSNVNGCCPDDQMESWDDSVKSCIHGIPPGGWQTTISAAETDAIIAEEEIEDIEDLGDLREYLIDSAAAADSSISSAMGIAISFVVMIGH